MTDDQLRSLLEEYTKVNDGYVHRLLLKDQALQRYLSRIDELELQVEQLRNAVFTEVSANE